ncbi:MAG: hypothetical protein Q9227_000424 [Pyrenula ochraceoflavens]
MRTTVLLALAGLAAAAPAPSPQGLDFQEIDAAGSPTIVTPPVDVTKDVVNYDVKAAEASATAAVSADPASPVTKRGLQGRDACQAQPAGSAPTTSPDTDQDFLSNPTYDNIAENAPTPQGYSQSFSDLHGSTEGPGYMGLYTLETYDTIKCQQLCDAAPACYAFNIYIERDPSVDPADSCPNPPSTVNYKCTLWGQWIDSSTATNQGQWRNQFHVVFAGSNGYNKQAPPPSVSGFSGPVEFGGAINAPSGYIGAKVYPNSPLDPSVCASACTAQTAYNSRHPNADGTFQTCAFFNMYILSKNNVPQGLTCSLYSQTWDKSYSNNYGQNRGGDYYSVSQSYGYSLSQ